MTYVVDRIRTLPPERIKVLARPIGILCLEHTLELELHREQRAICERVLVLLRDPHTTEGQLSEAAYAAASADNAARAAAYAAASAANAASNELFIARLLLLVGG